MALSKEERDKINLENLAKAHASGTGGRPKGRKNDFTNLKQTFLDTFQRLEGEDKTDLYSWARKNRKDFYRLVAKMLPKTVEGNITVNNLADELLELLGEIDPSVRERFLTRLTEKGIL